MPPFGAAGLAVVAVAAGFGGAAEVGGRVRVAVAVGAAGVGVGGTGVGVGGTAVAVGGALVGTVVGEATAVGEATGVGVAAAPPQATTVSDTAISPIASTNFFIQHSFQWN